MKLQISNARKSYGAQDVLSGASLQVKGNEKIALVGRNGCGKTTLLRIITGEEELDAGTRTVASDLVIGSLNQIVFEDESRTVLQELESVFEPLKILEAQLNEQASLLATDHSEKALEKYDQLQTRFDTLGGYNYEHEMRSVFFHFGFQEEDLMRRLDQFSSGQRTRIALVRLLLRKPDILLLDEPTNHLDVDSIEWLESYVAHYPSAVVFVSHDRTFIDRVADEVVEIEFGRTTRYPGNYTHYVKAKEEWLAANHDAYVRQQKEIERLSALIEKFRYKASKAAFAQSKIRYLDRMEKIEDSREDRSQIHATFTSGRKGGNRVLEVENLTVGYDHPLCTVSFELFRQDRMAIVGPNGIGKSTLVKTVMGMLDPLQGHIHFGHQIDAGYFDQDSAQMSSSKTVLDELWDEHPQSTQTEIRNTLASFLFTGDEVFKEVTDLSGGEKVRLALAKLMMNHDNLLILDEPTNHLDIPAKEALEKALQDYDGTLLFVSHDRMFLSKMANRILETDTVGKVYAMGYTEYDERKKAGTLQQAQPAQPAKASRNTKPAPRSNAEIFALRKQLSNRISRLETLIAQTEEERDAMEELKFEPEYYQDYRKMEELQADIDARTDTLDAYMKEWEEKSMQLEELTQ